MSEKNVLCPLCKEEIAKELVETYGEYEIIRCCRCDVEFSLPFRQATSEDYDEAYRENEKQWQRAYKLKRKKRISFYDGFMDIYTVLYKSLRLPNKKGKLLDAGCGNGYFLSLMRELGYEVYGFDFSRVAVNFAKRVYKLKNVIACSWENVPLDWRDFSVITALEVVEHLDKPLEFLFKMRELLSPEGILIISVPNRERVGERNLYKIPPNYPPNHLTRWSRKALSVLLEKAGFKKIIVKSLAPPTVAIKEEFRFYLAPKSYGTSIGRIITMPISETLGRYISFFLRHLLWDKGAYLLGIGKNASW